MEFSDIDILIFQNLQFWYCSLGLSRTGQIRWLFFIRLPADLNYLISICLIRRAR